MLENGCASRVWRAKIFIERQPVDVAVTHASLQLDDPPDDY